jgi:hypothetical protein
MKLLEDIKVRCDDTGLKKIAKTLEKDKRFFLEKETKSLLNTIKKNKKDIKL